ncbi:TetR/AcrR family transcriptional regulator [Aquibacillus rhizosphaerae]|uniref:TetR/AcrR family transcriptional regulator n=1 Tax=Aquibacillus rhizosphaerae TaxID=3051431 RepID=A0ABT7LBJ9_9BACI|nr:TetR/AcrR family transcriptional regulator [Aquibacillus sp. LR5S19]MDL4843237.1 TetR/AcrR family transcriptional regulator [Aquibacillus sp. LR5S19]
MNSRKQHVIKMSHQLFIDRGYHATSIQDILDYSGISKGTFYNYFASKNELLISIFKGLHSKMKKERNELLIGKDESDLDVFIKQFELQMNINRKYKLFTLFEEVLISPDPELKQFVKEAQIGVIKWTFERFVEIFGEDKKPYLLDCAIMFIGILNQNMKYYALEHDRYTTGVHQVVLYSVLRVEKMVKELATSGEQLNEPELLDKWVPKKLKVNGTFQEELNQSINDLKKISLENHDATKYIELLDFIQDELLHAKNPRAFLIENTLVPLKNSSLFDSKQVEHLEYLVSIFFNEHNN